MHLDTTENACCANDNEGISCSLSTNGQRTVCNRASPANAATTAILLERTFSIKEPIAILG